MTYGWTLNNEQWKELYAVIGKRKWRRVPFDLYEKMEIPETHGVYVFCAKPCSGVTLDAKHLLKNLLNAVYIGQAVNLRQRFEGHWKHPMDPMIAVRHCFSTTLEFWFTTLDTFEELCTVERILIDCFGPLANRQRGPGLKGTLGGGQ